MKRAASMVERSGALWVARTVASKAVKMVVYLAASKVDGLVDQMVHLWAQKSVAQMAETKEK